MPSSLEHRAFVLVGEEVPGIAARTIGEREPQPRLIGPARATLEADDARWILALRTREQLQGGAAAVLPPESRVRLIDMGRRLGLRPFDTALVIAIVQDSRRAGSSFRSEGELVSRLRMVPSPVIDREAPADKTWWLAWMGGAVVLAAMITLAGAAWLG